MSYLDKCVVKTDLMFRNLKPSRNIIILIQNNDCYIPFSLNDYTELVKNFKNHYIEETDALHTFFYFPNGIRIDSSLKDCFNNKANTMKLVKNEKQFRMGFEGNKQLFSFFSVIPVNRNEICSNEPSTFEETETEKNEDDEQVQIDWIKVEKQKQQRKRIEEKREAREERKRMKHWFHEKTVQHNADIKQNLFYQNSILTKEEWFKNDVRHREDDKPAFISFYDGGNKQKEIWYVNGKLHRENDEPAEIFYDETGLIKMKIWYKIGKQHREGDKPSCIRYNKSDFRKPAFLEWRKEGKLHRDDDKPAEIYIHQDEESSKKWAKDGEEYREDNKPPFVAFCKDGKIYLERYRINAGYAEFHYDKISGILKTKEITDLSHSSTMIFYDENGCVIQEDFMRDYFKLSKRIIYSEKNMKEYEMTFECVGRERKQFHLIYYQNTNNSIKSMEWFKNKKRYREDNLPAVISFYENGRKKDEQWFVNGRIDRIVKYREEEFDNELINTGQIQCNY